MRSNRFPLVFLLICIALLLGLTGRGHWLILTMRANIYYCKYTFQLFDPVKSTQFANAVLRWADAYPEHATSQRLAGIRALQMAQGEESLKYLSRANTLAPNHVVTLHGLGLAYELVGDYVKAMESMAIAGNETYLPESLDDVSSSHLIQIVRDSFSHSLSAEMRLALAMRVYTLDEGLAWRSFLLALDSVPDDATYHLQVAWFYFHQRDFDSAVVIGTHARALFPDNPWVKLFGGTLNRARGNYVLAAEDLKEVILAFTNEEVARLAHIELSKVYIAQQKYALALEHLEIAEQMQTGHLAVYLLRAQAYASLGQCAQAWISLAHAENLIITEQQEIFYTFSKQEVGKTCP